jgi:ribosome-associated protein
MDIPFELKGEHVRLCDLLKLVGVAESGGQGKHIIAAGEVKVDGQPESRKSAKIRAGQTVECRGAKIKVTAEAAPQAEAAPAPEPPVGEQ